MKQTKSNEVITPSLFKENTQRIYQHSYLDSFEDRILYGQADGHETSIILNNWNEIRERDTPHEDAVMDLAGDLREEYSCTLSELDVNGYIKYYLCGCLSTILHREVVDISMISENQNKGMVETLWVNYVKSNDYNPSHGHSGLYSCVWYLDIPEEIREEWKEQKGNSASRGLVQFFSARENSCLTFNPKTNDVLLFSAKHLHQVYPFKTDNTRISMALNINQIIFEDGEKWSAF